MLLFYILFFVYHSENFQKCSVCVCFDFVSCHLLRNRLHTLGGGLTFFKVGGHKCMTKIYRKFLWIELATVMSQALKYDVITFTPYEGLNYTILEKITPL